MLIPFTKLLETTHRLFWMGGFGRSSPHIPTSSFTCNGGPSYNRIGRRYKQEPARINTSKHNHFLHDTQEHVRSWKRVLNF